MINMIPLKAWLVLGAVMALGALIFFWRAEIYRAAENAYTAFTNAKTIEVNETSKKETDNVRKKIQSLDERALDKRLCDLGIVRGAEGCERH